MTELSSLIKLQTWLSPSFPIGAFSYSHGLEVAVDCQYIETVDDLSAWLEDLLTYGPGWNDAVLLAQAWHNASSEYEIKFLADLSTALSISDTRRLETTAQGSAFIKAASAWRQISVPKDCPLPVAVGVTARLNDVGLDEILVTYLHAYISNQIQASLRLMRLGQQSGVEVLAALEPILIATAKKASASSILDMGSHSILADIAAMKHETMQSRIFRS